MLDRLKGLEILVAWKVNSTADCFLVVIPLEVCLDWTLAERLECKTGTKLAKFKNSTAKT